MDTDIQGLSTLSLGSGLPDADHTFAVYYRGRTPTLDSWTTPANGLKVTGMSLNVLAATSAPAVQPARLLWYGDSITEGHKITTTVFATGQDSTSAIPFLAAKQVVRAGQRRDPRFN